MVDSQPVPVIIPIDPPIQFVEEPVDFSLDPKQDSGQKRAVSQSDPTF